MAGLVELLNEKGTKFSEVTAYLDTLTGAQRVEQVMALGKTEQVRMWELAQGSKTLELTYLVPAHAKPLEFFPFEGKNSLPMFKRFRKVFYRDSKGGMCGYNDNPKFVQLTIGHGYFVVQMNPAAPAEIQIDYTRVPTQMPEGWPKIRSNDVFPTMFVYGGTKDHLRWVSKDVVIGRAFKGGVEPMPNWFVLCRP
ncbi:MAG TPA: hypothetical protein VM658_15240 [bacterium]|nr:hypothetical protein [bacterium]